MIGSPKTSSGVSESSAVSSAASSGSSPSIPGTGSGSGSSGSSGSFGGCNLFATDLIVFSSNLVTFTLVNDGSTDVEVLDIGLDVATPTVSPTPPFTILAGGSAGVSITTVLANDGGTIAITNDCNGPLFLFIP